MNSKKSEDPLKMENISSEVRSQSIKSFQSTIIKSENALAQMTQKGANTTLIRKRLNALTIGLAMLEYVWNQKEHPYTKADLAEAKDVLTSLFPSIEKIYAKSKDGSPQKTLLKRRIKSLELAVEAIGDYCNDVKAKSVRG
jgi:hypothetical protein